MVKVGRPKAGEVRDSRVGIGCKITESQKSQLNWLLLELKLTTAELIGLWIEEAFSRQGEMAEAAAVESRAVEFVKALAAGRKPDILEMQKFADEIGVESQKLAALVALAVKCCCETEEKESRGKTHS